MAVDNETLKRSRPGATPEEVNSLTGKAGVYRHPESGQEAICTWDPLLGNTQAEAFLRLGFVFVRDAEEGDIKTPIAASLEAEAAKDRTAASVGSVKGIEARLDNVEAANAALTAERDSLRAQLQAGTSTADFPGAEQTKQAAIDQTIARQEEVSSDTSGVNTEDPLVTPEAKPLEKQNTTELKETAAQEGVELTEEHDTKKKIVEAIQEKRDEEGTE